MNNIKLIINSKKYDVNGNAIYNVKLEQITDNKSVNITEYITKLATRNKVLKNGTVNIKQYKSFMISCIKNLISAYLQINDSNYNLEIVDNT